MNTVCLSNFNLYGKIKIRILTPQNVVESGYTAHIY